jgi:hypothetical protein
MVSRIAVHASSVSGKGLPANGWDRIVALANRRSWRNSSRVTGASRKASVKRSGMRIRTA